MPKDVMKLADKVVRWLKPYSKRIQIVGSIRRKEKNPKDIDIVLIPKNRIKLEEFLHRSVYPKVGNKRAKKRARFIQGGEHESTWRIESISRSGSPKTRNSGCKVELYYTTSEEWGAALLAYSSKKGSGIGLRVVAKKKGFKLNNHGLFKGSKRVAGKTEREIYKALGRPYKEPEDR